MRAVILVKMGTVGIKSVAMAPRFRGGDDSHGLACFYRDPVMPAQAGIQSRDSRSPFHGGDGIRKRLEHALVPGY